jgi:NAD(P)-dependent dehydrogenase (short-subunit alcohol dehydrogenase family)
VPLDGQVALVTGAAAGIGAATAFALAAERCAVAVVDLDGDGADRVAGRIEADGGRAVAIQADLGDAARAARVVSGAISELGRVDILVNCAGIYPKDAPAIVDLDEATWDRVCAVNLKAPFLLTQAFARHVVGRGGGGRIVNLSSSGAYRAGSNSAYGATKAALVQLTRSAAGELAQYGVNANAVAPGITRTPMALEVFGGDEGVDRAAAGANLFGRASEPDEVAAVIVFLCLPASSQITAQVIHTSAGGVIS